jgi:hypothetical protein
MGYLSERHPCQSRPPVLIPTRPGLRTFAIPSLARNSENPDKS